MSIRLNPDLLPSLLSSIQQSQENESVSTQQLASGRSVNQLSDNPTAAASLVQNHNQAGADAEFLQSLSSLQSRYQVADGALSNVVSSLTRALSLAPREPTARSLPPTARLSPAKCRAFSIKPFPWRIPATRVLSFSPAPR